MKSRTYKPGQLVVLPRGARLKPYGHEGDVDFPVNDRIGFPAGTIALFIKQGSRPWNNVILVDGRLWVIHEGHMMSNRSVRKILDEIATRQEQEKTEEFENYVSNLKIGDLVFVTRDDIICEITFNEKPLTGIVCRQGNNNDVKHIHPLHPAVYFTNYIPRFQVDKPYPALLIEKCLSFKYCSCFFAFADSVKKSDLFVLIDTKLYYVRLRLR